MISRPISLFIDRYRFTVSYLSSAIFGNIFFNAGYSPCPDDLKILAPFDREPLQAALCDAVVWRSVEGMGVEKSAAILDIGCGSGGGLLVAAHRYPDAEIVGVDPDAVAIWLANRRLKAHTKVRALQGSGGALPFPADQFDLVYAVGTLGFVGLSPFFSEAARVLRPKGVLSLQGWNVDVSLADELANIRSVANNVGFEIVEFRDITSNVIEAIKADIPRRYAYVDRIPWPFRSYAREASVLPGTEAFELYTGGRYQTYLCVCRFS